MFPILIDIGPITIHTYGFFVALGLLAGIFLATREARRLGLDGDKVMDMCFYIVVAAIAGSRLLYVIQNLETFRSAPLEMFKIWKGGLVFYGGFIGALVVVLVYLRIHRLPLGKIADIAAVSVPLGHFFGRLGCLSAGCCYGVICECPWAVTFSHPEALAPLQVPLHPTQLYEAVANLAIFLILFSFRHRKHYHGQLFLIYVMLYGSIRSVIEIVRGDFRGADLFGIFSISQAAGISLALAALVMLIIFRKQTLS
jgi:phosphatidylglycerol---prolipoprotein diacylglyceryl transferase